MKLKRARIENFKGVRDVDIDFTHGDGVRPLTALVGDNGSGKTTVLQAIALTLSLATRRTRRTGNFAWHGFLADRVGSLGDTRVELTLAFDDVEIQRVQALFGAWKASRPPEFLQEARIVEPSALGEVTLSLRPSFAVESPQGFAATLQFLGRYYIKTVLPRHPDSRAMYRDVGDVFWFDQMRNLGSSLDESGRGDPAREAWSESGLARESWSAGVEQLREELVGWWGYHTSPRKDPELDFLAKLEASFDNIFPRTRLAGIAPRGAADEQRAREFYFLFERDGRVYDLAELSSGEQAVFPLLREFVRLEIRRSIVLIDELELHLHPPQQQALLGALRKLGPDCQYIITTHSPALEDAIPDDQIVRLERGRRCP